MSVLSAFTSQNQFWGAQHHFFEHRHEIGLKVTLSNIASHKVIQSNHGCSRNGSFGGNDALQVELCDFCPFLFHYGLAVYFLSLESQCAIHKCSSQYCILIRGVVFGHITDQDIQQSGDECSIVSNTTSSIAKGALSKSFTLFVRQS
jgi:hypothetical protein